MRKTPWGIAQRKVSYCRGINFYSTARHGGYCVSKTHLDTMHPALRSIGTKDGWFEEDCAASAVHVSFPKLFSDPAVLKDAHRVLVNYYPDQYSLAYSVEIPIEESYELRRREFFKQSANKFAVKTAARSANADEINVYAIKRSTNEARYFVIPKAEYTPNEFGFVIDETKHKVLEF